MKKNTMFAFVQSSQSVLLMCRALFAFSTDFVFADRAESFGFTFGGAVSSALAPLWCVCRWCGWWWCVLFNVSTHGAFESSRSSYRDFTCIANLVWCFGATCDGVHVVMFVADGANHVVKCALESVFNFMKKNGVAPFFCVNV